MWHLKINGNAVDIILLYNTSQKIIGFISNMLQPRAYLRGGSGGSNPPPPKFSDFFLKSEGKELERKRKKRDVGGGGYLLT